MNFSNITTKRQFRDCTAMDRHEFDQLCADAESYYLEAHERSYEQYVLESVTEPPKFKHLSDALFFVLFQKKNDLVYGALGATFDMDGSSAHLNYNKFNLLLEQVLEKKKVMPMREATDEKEFANHVSEAEELLVDGTEMPIERPSDNDNQRVMYSGKKKRHTDAAVVISDPQRYIYFVSQLYEGSTVDIEVLRGEFTPGGNWFKDKTVSVDLGYVGVQKDYEFGTLHIGIKRPRRKKKTDPKIEFTEAQKAHNKAVSSRRIYVEHAIGEMKRYRVLINRSRIRCYRRKNHELGICAGLANYKNRLRRPVYE